MRLLSTWEGKALPLAGGTMTGDITMSGADIILGANKLKTTNLALLQKDASNFQVRNADNDAYRSVHQQNLAFYGYLASKLTGGYLVAAEANDAYFSFFAYDNDVAKAEVARLIGAADPYFQATLPMVIKPTARPGTLADGHLTYNSTTKELEIYKTDHHQQFVHTFCKVIEYDDSTPVALFTIPAGSFVYAVMVKITTPFVGTSPTLDVGDEDDPNGFIDNGDITQGTEGWYPTTASEWGVYLRAGGTETEPKFYTSAKALRVAIGGTGLSAGVAEVYIVYSSLSK